MGISVNTHPMRTRSVFLSHSAAYRWAELRAILQDLPGVRIVGESTRIDEASPLVIAQRPDVLLTADEIDGETILPLLAALRQECPESLLIVLARTVESGDLGAFFDLGGDGYLLWREHTDVTLRQSLAAIISGEVVVRSRAAATAYLQLQRGDRRLGANGVTLTDNERAVLRGLALGLAQRQIAEREHLGLRTVERALATLRLKLDAPSEFVLALKARRLGLVA